MGQLMGQWVGWVMGQWVNGSWVSDTMGQMGHGSPMVTHGPLWYRNGWPVGPHVSRKEFSSPLNSQILARAEPSLNHLTLLYVSRSSYFAFASCRNSLNIRGQRVDFDFKWLIIGAWNFPFSLPHNTVWWIMQWNASRDCLSFLSRATNPCWFPTIAGAPYVVTDMHLSRGIPSSSNLLTSAL